MRVPLSGITYTSQLEWRLAAKEFHYTWEQFTALEGWEQAEIVAAYRIEKQINAVLSMRKR